jgi:hypothetical protein
MRASLRNLKDKWVKLSKSTHIHEKLRGFFISNVIRHKGQLLETLAIDSK